jgi:two-component sensor histidine kinase
MTLAHELLYQSDNFAFVSSKSYLTKLLEHLISSFIGLGSGITINGKIGDCELGIDTAIPLGLIMTELVSNCIKHAFPDAGPHEIRVLFECTEKEFKLSVMDDGAGIPSDIDPHESKSMGLDLIKIFVRQLNGNLEIKRDNGTHASIVFPGSLTPIQGSF